jgi:hypothetical protein
MGVAGTKWKQWQQCRTALETVWERRREELHTEGARGEVDYCRRMLAYLDERLRRVIVHIVDVHLWLALMGPFLVPPPPPREAFFRWWWWWWWWWCCCCCWIVDH